jgi:hypothetical protein
LFWVRFGPVECDFLRFEGVEMMEHGLEEWEFGREFGELRRCTVEHICE